MILPTKHIKPENSLLWVGSEILNQLDSPRTINSLWNEVKEEKYIRSFDKFILTLDFLYMLEVIKLDGNFIKRQKS